MRKRERENPCGICGHYHKYEAGEVCGICGHRLPVLTDKTPPIQLSIFPSEILPDFLYLGSYDDASRAQLLKTQGISRVLNDLINLAGDTVPACQNLYKNSFTYHCLQEEQKLPFDDANQFLEQCATDKARVLVHCMLGKNRSPAIVIAYLMKSKGWRLAQSYQWVKERKPVVELSEVVYQQLQEYEQKLYGSTNSNPGLPITSSGVPSFSFGVTESSDPSLVPAFSTVGTTSIFARPISDVPQAFTFGAGQAQTNASENPLTTAPISSGNDITMDGS
ncbi:protein phosphatase [Lithospermum erythrorhizon]|uniref:Protein phosphatase n=1 Tax=Lithospermum erythrorhizon TaxID=34254 RepID=A0AAV3P9Q7_LITER